jgi:hypothetical protein
MNEQQQHHHQQGQEEEFSISEQALARLFRANQFDFDYSFSFGETVPLLVAATATFPLDHVTSIGRVRGLDGKQRTCYSMYGA